MLIGDDRHRVVDEWTAADFDEAVPKSFGEPPIPWMNPATDRPQGCPEREQVVLAPWCRSASACRRSHAGGSRCQVPWVENPQAPASIATSSSRHISFELRRSGDDASSPLRRPSRTMMMGASGAYVSTFTPSADAPRCRGTPETSPSPTAYPACMDPQWHSFVPSHGEHCAFAMLRPTRRKPEAAVADRDRRHAVPAGDRTPGIPEEL